MTHLYKWYITIFSQKCQFFYRILFFILLFFILLFFFITVYFESEEKASNYDTIVKLQSAYLSPKNCEDELYTELTYSINGGDEKTIYAHKEVINKPDSLIIVVE